MSESGTVLVGRNEPCPCGSKKKYKRCHGVDAAPKVTPPKNPAPMAGGGMGGGFDPSKMDPAMMNQMAAMMQRLPKGQLQKLQALMQKAMSGQDVTEEAQSLEKMMPPELLQTMEAMRPQLLEQAAAAGMPMPGDAEMSEGEARKIVEEAVKEGRISAAEAEAMLALPSTADASPAGEKEGRWSKLWSGLKRK